MKETLGQQFTQMCEDMKKSPEIFFEDQREPRFNYSFNNETGHTRALPALKYGSFDVENNNSISVREGDFQSKRITHISTFQDSLRIHAHIIATRSQIAMNYGFDDNGRGFAKELRLWSTEDHEGTMMPLALDTPERQVLALQRREKAKFSNVTPKYSRITANFTAIPPDLMRGNTTVTYVPTAEASSTEPEITAPVFSELPVRDVTIQMLHNWMQQTFPQLLKPVKIEAVANRQRLSAKIKPIFRGLTPTDDTLDVIACREALGWDLVWVSPVDDVMAPYHHSQLIKNKGAKNVFHYQMTAKPCIGVNLFFTKNR